MTRKDYIALAAALKDAKPVAHPTLNMTVAMGAWLRAVTNVSDVLAADNGRFDRDRFERACEAV